MAIKIDHDYLKSIENNFNPSEIFGEWFTNSSNKGNEQLNIQYQNNQPFSHIVIPNFLNSEYIEKIYNEFPDINTTNFYYYNNPLENKYAYDDINNLDTNIKNLFYYLSTKECNDRFSKLSNILDLQYDEYLHGAGCHVMTQNSRLLTHLDYEKNPLSGKQRRMNIILYLSKDWDNDWSGETKLFDQDLNCVVKSPVIFNTAIIFKTNEISYHGVPDKIVCPNGKLRKTIAYYYVSELESVGSVNKLGSNQSGYREKAAYILTKDDINIFKTEENLEKVKKFQEIRPHRRITEQDIENYWSEWSSEMY